MFEKLVLGAFFASLNTIGIWRSIPLTGISPSNTIWWRGLNSLEIAWSIHELRKIHPFMFTNNDATSKVDLLLQYSINVEQYEDARLALERSLEASSLYIDVPGATATDYMPSDTAAPTSFYLGDGSDAEYNYEKQQQQQQWSDSAPQNNTFLCTLVIALFLVLVLMLIMGLVTASNIGTRVEDLHYHYFKEMDAIQRELMRLLSGFQHFQEEFDEVRPVIDFLAESLNYCASDLQRCLVHVVGMMEEKYTSSMCEIESKLDEVSLQHQSLIRNTENFPQIPKQLAWLNILVAKTMSPDLPEDPHMADSGLNLDVISSGTQKQTTDKSDVAAKTNAISRSKAPTGTTGKTELKGLVKPVNHTESSRLPKPKGLA
ncbi:hypothetical protein N7475_005961 [Penicillium sp. IBT 31633x]|nr:hypothetical protein N7475_005961 [Penicillium sp. IBT 31633x]